MAPSLESRRTTTSLVIGVTKLAWMYGKSRDWAERLLREWYDAQRAGTAPVRVFPQGKRGSLYTTLPILHQVMPPGRDLALYQRMSAVEAEAALAHQRIDQERAERKRDIADLQRQIQTRRAS